MHFAFWSQIVFAFEFRNRNKANLKDIIYLQQGSPKILSLCVHIAHCAPLPSLKLGGKQICFCSCEAKILGTRQLEVKMHCSRKFQRLTISKKKNITKRKLFQRNKLGNIPPHRQRVKDGFSLWLASEREKEN